MQQNDFQQDLSSFYSLNIPVSLPDFSQINSTRVPNQQVQPLRQNNRIVLNTNIPIIPICIKNFPVKQKHQLHHQQIFKLQKLKQNQKLKSNIDKNITSKNNENRNILPNSIHQIISYVQKKHKSGLIAQKIINRLSNHPNWTSSRYYIYQRLLRDKKNYYLTETSLKLLMNIHDPTSEIYSIEEQHFYMKVSRMLAMYFLNSQSIPLFINSRRMSSSKRIQHFKNRRELLLKIKDIFHS